MTAETRPGPAAETCDADRVRSRLDDDEIRLVIPATPAYSRVARVAVSGIAARLGLRLAEIEDLRIAVDETLILLLRSASTADTIALTFHIQAGRLTIEAGPSAAPSGHRLDDAVRSRFEHLVGPVVDEYQIGEHGERVRLVKTLPT